MGPLLKLKRRLKGVLLLKHVRIVMRKSDYVRNGKRKKRKDMRVEIFGQCQSLLKMSGKKNAKSRRKSEKKLRRRLKKHLLKKKTRLISEVKRKRRRKKSLKNLLL